MWYINIVSSVMVKMGFCQFFFQSRCCALEEKIVAVSLPAADLAKGSLFLLGCFEGCLVLPVAPGASCESLEVGEQSLQGWMDKWQQRALISYGLFPFSFRVVVLLCGSFLMLSRGCWGIVLMRQKLLFPKGPNLTSFKTFQWPPWKQN